MARGDRQMWYSWIYLSKGDGAMNGYALAIPARFLAMVLGAGAGYGNIRCLWSRWLSNP